MNLVGVWIMVILVGRYLLDGIVNIMGRTRFSAFKPVVDGHVDSESDVRVYISVYG